MLKWSGWSFDESSRHAKGVETVAPGRARVENGATLVAPRSFRK
jgi:hypothetical protein